MWNKRTQIVATAALAFCAVMWSLQTWHMTGLKMNAILRKQKDIRQIQELSRQWEPEWKWVEELEKQPTSTPVSLESLAEQTLGTGSAHVTFKTPISLPRQWILHIATVDIRDIPYVELYNFLHAASQSPAVWRLRELILTPGAEAGHGAAHLTLETLEKNTGN